MRRGSILEHMSHPLKKCAALLRAFEAGLTVTEAAQEHAVSTDTCTKLWKSIRQRCDRYIQAYPIRFPRDEIVEIDELYLAPLQPTLQQREEGRPPVWVIGCIGRNTGWVGLDIANDHTAATIRPLMEAHLPHKSTVCITDKDQSFSCLKQRHPHYWSEKRKAGGALWVVTYSAQNDLGTVTVHTNTIEGYWSQVRRKLHDSHGWPAQYLPLVLSEFMFRSLKLPLTAAIRAC